MIKNLLLNLTNGTTISEINSISSYCFITKVMISTLNNINNNIDGYKMTLEYYQNSINFDNFLGLTYEDFEIQKPLGKKGFGVNSTGKSIVTKEKLEDPKFKAMLITLMNFKIPQYITLPDQRDHYDLRYHALNDNLWNIVLDNIIKDGTLDKETVSWFMKFALLLHQSQSNINYSTVPGDYLEKINSIIEEIAPYKAILEEIIENMGISSYMQRYYRFDIKDLYLTNLKHDRIAFKTLIKTLDLYKNSKYFDESIETLYLGTPIFNCVKIKSGNQSVFENRYRWATDASSFKNCITSLAEISNVITDAVEDTKNYKEHMKKLNDDFLDTYADMINNDYKELFSTKTIGAMKRVKYGRNLSASEIAGMKLLNEISDKFEDRKFAKSIGNYYANAIL